MMLHKAFRCGKALYGSVIELIDDREDLPKQRGIFRLRLYGVRVVVPYLRIVGVDTREDGLVEAGDRTRQLLCGPHAFSVVQHPIRSEEHTSELQSLMRISYAVFCLKKKNKTHQNHNT